MKIEKTLTRIYDACVVALGCFDGVHAGHRAVIENAAAIAKKSSLPLTVLTFDLPPRNFFAPGSVRTISSTIQKLELLAELGADAVISLPLKAEYMSIYAESFVRDTLISTLGARTVACGYNYTFGAGARGNTELLKKICAEMGVRVSITPSVLVDGQAVSSSAIREALLEGDVKKAQSMLMRPFSVRSRVVHGQHLATELGFPTINLIPDRRQILPKNGVYAVNVNIEGRAFGGIANSGIRPTVNGKDACIEVHVFDFDGDLYDEDVEVEFIRFIRDERKFADVGEMSEQIKKDIQKAKKQRAIQ